MSHLQLVTIVVLSDNNQKNQNILLVESYITYTYYIGLLLSCVTVCIIPSRVLMVLPSLKQIKQNNTDKFPAFILRALSQVEHRHFQVFIITCRID